MPGQKAGQSDKVSFDGESAITGQLSLVKGYEEDLASNQEALVLHSLQWLLCSQMEET